MKPPDFLERVQGKVAFSAVSPSSLRGQGRGLVHCAQKFLAALPLDQIPRSTKDSFVAWLDRQTAALDRAFPPKAKRWGAARKVINLFLRDALYNGYLNREFQLSAVESWLEVPLDGVMARGLKRIATRGKLPPWRGLKRVTRHESKRFQQFAEEEAYRKGMARVHLDIYLWLDQKRASTGTPD
jgi:hypothetical protein